jgi:methylamine---corrinoid protein Co-methyltransferase
VMRHRGVEDPTRAVVHSGPTGTPCSERYHPLILLSCAQEPLIDCLGAGSVSTYRGEPIIPGSPLELMGARRDASVAREAVRMAGRPGMHINDVAVPLTCAGKMAAYDPQAGLRPSDGILVSQMVELKTDFDQLSRVAHLYNVGGVIVDLMTPLLGGLGGRPEGTAVVSVADHLLGVVLYDADYHMFSLTHLSYVNNTEPMGIWTQAMVGQALSRNTPIVLLNDIYTLSGPGTTELLYECAAGAVVGTVCGFNMQGAGTTGGFNQDHTTGLETSFIAEVSRASLGLTRQEAAELIPRIMPGYIDTLHNPNRGKPFKDVYDVETVLPRQEWLDMYYRVKEDVAKFGLKFDIAPRSS